MQRIVSSRWAPTIVTNGRINIHPLNGLLDIYIYIYIYIYTYLYIYRDNWWWIFTPISGVLPCPNWPINFPWPPGGLESECDCTDGPDAGKRVRVTVENPGAFENGSFSCPNSASLLLHKFVSGSAGGESRWCYSQVAIGPGGGLICFFPTIFTPGDDDPI